MFAAIVRFSMLMTLQRFDRLKNPTGPMPHRPVLRMRLRLI